MGTNKLNSQFTLGANIGPFLLILELGQINAIARTESISCQPELGPLITYAFELLDE